MRIDIVGCFAKTRFDDKVTSYHYENTGPKFEVGPF